MPAPKIPFSVARVGLAAVAAGLTHDEAAELAGVSVRTVGRWVAEHGVRRFRECTPRAGVLTVWDREEIWLGIERGESNTVIGDRVGFHRSTIYREIKANGGREFYRPHSAHLRGLEQASRGRDPWTVTRLWLWEQVQDMLRALWSPEQIAAMLRWGHPDESQWWVSHESIYQAIFVQAKGELRKELAACLRTGRAKREPHARAKTTGSRIKNMVNIVERPPEVQDRAVPGHWEGDLIMGANNKTAVATLVERSTRFGLLVKIDNKTAEHVAERLAEAAARIPTELFKSLTWDQGTEMAAHATFSIETGAPVFFCDPHSPWQRGTNENWNGLVRQYMPKGTDLSVHTQDDLDAMARSLNTRPRKTLGWDNPAQRLNQLVATTA